MNITILKQQYIKEKDTVYCSLLRLACINDNVTYNQSEVALVIDNLNQLPIYESVHKRLIPLLLVKARNLNIFERLNESTQQILLKKAKLGIVSQLAKQYQLDILINEFNDHKIPMILINISATSDRVLKQIQLI